VWASKDQVICAVNALRKTSTDTKLWVSDSPVQIIFALGYITDLAKDFRPRAIPLPSPLLPTNADVCLVVKDTIDTQLLATLKLSGIKKVIKRNKFEVNYKDFEEKQKLCGRFDLFLVERGTKAYHPLFGKAFISKKKVPVPIVVTDADQVKQKIEQLKSSAFYNKSSGGNSITIKAARLDQTDEEIVGNIMAVLSHMRPIFGKKVQSISLKTPDSLSLPIYQTIVIPEGRILLKRKAPARATPHPLEHKAAFAEAAKKVRILSKKEEQAESMQEWKYRRGSDKTPGKRTVRLRN